MVDWGMSLVRLGVTWESVETIPGQYNMTYLDEMDKLINRLGERGIYTMVDAHQDLFSRKTCGEGFPTFYVNDLSSECPHDIPGFFFWLTGNCKSIKSYNFTLDENGLPLIEECVKTFFIKYYTAPEVCSSFERLYQNTEGVLDKFADFWVAVGKKFSTNPYVIGYDPLNEPWPANFYKDWSLFYSQAKFDSEYLFPLLKRIHNSIR
jgi:endoglycosylceramidase